MDLELLTQQVNNTKESVILQNANNLVLLPTENQNNSVLVTRIAGFDTSFGKKDPSIAVSCIVIYSDHKVVKLDTPYIPGFLAARELGPYLHLFQKIKDNPNLLPQLIFVDGNGILHPRKCGLASLLGVQLNIPTLGVSKNFLSFENLVYSNKSIKSKLLSIHSNDIRQLTIVGNDGFVYGMAFLPKGLVNPIYVSVGNLLSLDFAVLAVKKCSVYRIPEPIRQADHISRNIVHTLDL
ncbi:hypothetical protein BB560_002656 [Smittium megazygosporum]|uniref:Endonuclease V n=1 Tax=Smittium megazygosporum TaxID=133381 RepID=A0A2T9ZE35_9FUNG|nr:hypothetical protein BB560_002656 [Smittium megazygosporum]